MKTSVLRTGDNTGKGSAFASRVARAYQKQFTLPFNESRNDAAFFNFNHNYWRF